MTEPAEECGAGSGPSMLQTSATLDGNHWVSNGRTAFITGADGAGVGIVMARTVDGASLFLVDLPDPTIRIERVLDTIDSSMPGGHAIVAIEQLRVAADQMLGQSGEGFRYAQIRLSPARLSHCMRWHGGATRAHAVATAYPPAHVEWRSGPSDGCRTVRILRALAIRPRPREAVRRARPDSRRRCLQEP